MTDRRPAVSPRAASGVALLAVAGLALSACGQHPYPQPSAAAAEPMPPPPAGDLMGAPQGPDAMPPPAPPQAYAPAEPGLEAPAQPPGPPAYGPPSGRAYAQNEYGPDGAQGGYARPDYAQNGYAQNGYAQNGYGQNGYAQNGYAQGGYGQAPSGPPEIISNAPIPNPPEDEGRGYRHHRHHHHGYGYRHDYGAGRYGYTPVGPESGRYGAQAPVFYAPMVRAHGRHHRHHGWRRYAYAAAPVYAAPMHHNFRHAPAMRGAFVPAPVPMHHGRRHRVDVAHPAAPKPSHTLTHAAPPPAAAAPAAAPVAPKPAPHLVPPPSASTGATATSDNTFDANTAGTDQTSNLSALAGALSPVIASRAMLAVPDLKPGVPADVSLTVPPDFADGLRDAARKNGLADAAASTNLTAKLSGDGYAVTPTDPQAQPLTAGQATVFKWTVTQQAGAKGPLRADVGADLLGGGTTHIDLGSVQKAGGHALALSPRAIGAGLLVLLVIVVGALFTGGRRRRGPDGASKPRSGHMN